MAIDMIRQNPCRFCSCSIIYKGKHCGSMSVNCFHCEYKKAHEKYLASKRKYSQGELIASPEELLTQTWVMFHGKPKHHEAILNMQLRTVLSGLKYGSFRKAVENKEHLPFENVEESEVVENAEE